MLRFTSLLGFIAHNFPSSNHFRALYQKSQVHTFSFDPKMVLLTSQRADGCGICDSAADRCRFIGKMMIILDMISYGTQSFSH